MKKTMTNYGGMQESFIGSVAKHSLRPSGEFKVAATSFLFVLTLTSTLGLHDRITAAEGDPQITVPTLQQGRAILARDMLHQQCLQAQQEKEWQRLSRLAKQALSEEQQAFGADFEGSIATRLYQELADVALGKQTVFIRQAKNDFEAFLQRESLRSQQLGDTNVDGETRLKALAKSGEKLLALLDEYIKLSVKAEQSFRNAETTNDYSEAERLFARLYQLERDVIKDLRSDEKSSDAHQAANVVLAVSASTTAQFGYVKAEVGDAEAGLELLREAFSIVCDVEPFWYLDTGENEEEITWIVTQLLFLLENELYSQRSIGSWRSAVQIADEMLPLANKLWNSDHHYRALRSEANELTQKPKDAQNRYAKTVLEQVEFESAISGRRFPEAIEIGARIVDERTSILGPDCVEAAKINQTLGALYWTQRDYANAYSRLADAALVFAKHLPRDDHWLKASMSDLYVNAISLAQLTEQPSDLVPRLERVVDSLAELLTEEHFGVAEGRLCLISVRRIMAMNAEEREAYASLTADAVERDALWSNGRYPEAAKVGKALTDQAKQLFGEPSAQHLVHLRGYANSLANSGNAEASLALYTDLLEQYDVPPFNRTSSFHWSYHGMAHTLSMIGERRNNEEALKWLAKARHLAAETLGERTNAYASHLEMEAQILRDNLNAPAKALQKYQEANSIHEATYWNQDSFDYCQGLVNVGLCQNELRLWEAAEQQLRLSLEIRERNNYQNPRMLAWNLWALGRNAFDQRHFAEARDFFTRVLEIKEGHTPAANDIPSVYGQLLAASTFDSGVGGDSKQILKQFLDRRGRIYHDRPEDFADECRDAAQGLFESPGSALGGEMTRERQDLLEKLVIVGLQSYESAGISNDWRILELERMRGYAAELLDERERAFVIYRELLEQAQALEDPPHGLIGGLHIGLSNLHQSEFALDRTLQHRRLAREALEQGGFGEHSMRVADALKGEADTLLALGDYLRAEELTQRAADIFGELGHPMQAEIYQQLARIHSHRRDYDRAERYLYAARAHLSELGSHQELDLRIRLWLAKLMLAKGEFSLALETASQLIEGGSGVSDLQLNVSARSIRGIARLGLREAQAAYESLAEVLAEVEQSPLMQASEETRAAYAAACDRVGNRQEAKRQFRLLISELTKQHEVFGNVLSERQKLELRSKIHQAASVYVSHAIETDSPLAECYQTIMPLKGLVTARQRFQNASDKMSSPQLRSLSEQIDQINQELSSLLFGNAVANQKQSVERIGQLTEQRESLELRRNTLQKNVGDPSTLLVSEVRLEELRKLLKEDEALIDFVAYTHYDDPGLPDSKKEDRLLAFVITKKSLHAVPLGQVDQLESLVNRWHEKLRSGSGKEFGAVNQELADRVWDPIKTYVGEAPEVLLSPDGPLSKVSFAALPSENSGYLIDERVFVSVSAPRLLIQTRFREVISEKPALHAQDKGTLLLVGGVNYDSRSSAPGSVQPTLELVTANSAGSTPRGTALRSASSVTSWSYLPGTEEEIQQVASLAKNAQVASSTVTLDGADSSESAIAELASGATWMHLATHGFFAESNVDSGGWAFQSLSRQSVVGFDPRLLTGIVLAGANRPDESSREDGILTAAEIERLDLSNTELVVLSACETALGEGRSGEGVMGLQRSLHSAGCKHVIASLWKVDDQATAILMTEFYRQLWEQGKSPAEALRSAQQQLSRSRVDSQGGIRGDSRLNFESPKLQQASQRRLSPRYWAAFCLSSN